MVFICNYLILTIQCTVSGVQIITTTYVTHILLFHTYPSSDVRRPVPTVDRKRPRCPGRLLWRLVHSSQVFTVRCVRNRIVVNPQQPFFFYFNFNDSSFMPTSSHFSRSIFPESQQLNVSRVTGPYDGILNEMSVLSLGSLTYVCDMYEPNVVLRIVAFYIYMPNSTGFGATELTN